MRRKWSTIEFTRSVLAVCLVLPAFAQQNFYQSALDKFQQKQYEEALPLAERALADDRNNPTYIHLYGAILAAMDQFYLAEENLRKATTLAPNERAFAYDFGALLHRERKYAEAVPVLKRAVALDPENLTARMMLARSYVFSFHELQIPNFEELTLEQLRYIVKKDPRFPGVHHHIALVYINSGEPAKALEELNTELQFYPTNAQARLELGETLLKLNQFHKAAEELRAAAQQAPQMAPIAFALAKAYRADGQTAKAVDAARRCVELDANFADGHYLLSQLYRDANQPEQAREELERFRQLKGASSQ